MTNFPQSLTKCAALFIDSVNNVSKFVLCLKIWAKNINFYRLTPRLVYSINDYNRFNNVTSTKNQLNSDYFRLEDRR